MGSWLHSLPLWLYWTLMAPLILIGNGAFWLLVMAANEVVMPFPEWLTPKKPNWILLPFSLALHILLWDLLVALFFVPSLFYYWVLGWPWEKSALPGVVTSIVLIVMFLWFDTWRLDRRNAAEEHQRIEDEATKRRVGRRK